MKDIDFDELDKAVNSLMGGIKTKSDQPEPKTLNISTTLKEDEAPEYTKLQQVAEKIGSETIGGPTERTAILSEAADATTNTIELAATVTDAAPNPQQALPVSTPPARPTSPAVAPRRSSGRFMDVMHRSSDMKAVAAPASTPRREAAPIMPPSASAAPSPKTSPAEPSTEVTEPVAAASDTKSAELTSTSSELLSSPFLPDAKVEKRPLGSASPSVEETLAVVSESSMPSQEEKSGESGDPQLAPDMTKDMEIELPEELNNDLLAIETNLAVEPSENATTRTSSLDLAEEPASLPAAASDPGPASIPQQYKELPSSGDQSNGAIFDVNDYHKQPVQPVKSGSNWLWIVVIIIIIVICGAGAAAFYLLSAK